MKIKHLAFGTAVLVLGGLVMTPKLVGAYRGDPSIQSPNHSEERHAAMMQAFEDQDYQSWQELMQGKGRVSEVVTEENFAKFAEAHRLAQEGKLEEAHQIRQELGLGLNNGERQHRAGKGLGRRGSCPNVQ